MKYETAITPVVNKQCKHKTQRAGTTHTRCIPLEINSWLRRGTSPAVHRRDPIVPHHLSDHMTERRSERQRLDLPLLSAGQHLSITTALSVSRETALVKNVRTKGFLCPWGIFTPRSHFVLWTCSVSISLQARCSEFLMSKPNYIWGLSTSVPSKPILGPRKAKEDPKMTLVSPPHPPMEPSYQWANSITKRNITPKLWFQRINSCLWYSTYTIVPKPGYW